MNDIIDQMFNCEIGVDIVNRNYDDIQKLSDYVSPYIKDKLNNQTLVEYAKSCSNHWEILIFDTDWRDFNAYTGSLAEDFRRTHPVYTAGEILKMMEVSNNISEEDISKIFE